MARVLIPYNGVYIPGTNESAPQGVEGEGTGVVIHGGQEKKETWGELALEEILTNNGNTGGTGLDGLLGLSLGK